MPKPLFTEDDSQAFATLEAKARKDFQCQRNGTISEEHHQTELSMQRWNATSGANSLWGKTSNTVEKGHAKRRRHVPPLGGL